MRRSLISLSLLVAIGVPQFAAAAGGATIAGRVISTNGGLPIAEASIELDRAGSKVAETKTDSAGTYAFTGQAPGSYTILVAANGFVTTRLEGVAVGGGQSNVNLETAITPAAGLRVISTVTTNGHTALQTSATINQHVDAATIQSQNYARAGDALIGLPGVNTQTGSSIGDDLGVSVRGFNASETATLIDGHPVGPIGAFGSGFDYQVSPFYGLSGIDVIYGSGATGVYGASTIAGAINFRTLDPTLKPGGQFTTGVGSNGKLLSGLQLTGTQGKLGYAFANAVQGTYGNFAPQTITQTALLGSDISSANVGANTYTVAGTYLMRNAIGKLIYNFTPTTNLALTAYSATSWDDKSGNGDNDFNPYDYALYNAQQTIAGNPTTSVTLPNGNTATCTGTIAVISNASAGYSCLTAPQYASSNSGPSGGGPGPWQAIRNQDYHLRFQTLAGKNQITVDGFVDHYGLDYNRSSAGGGYHTNVYDTNGLLVGDEIVAGRNDISFGYYHQKQRQTGDAYPTVDFFGNLTNVQSGNPELDLTTSNYYLRDIYQASSKLTVFGDLWLQHLTETNTSSFNPRLSFVYRPTNADSVRLTAGRSNSVPDPSLLYALPSFNTTPQNINPVCGPNDLNSIGSVSDPNLIPEVANDAEFAYGHRFRGGVTAQVDVYTSYERNALFNGNLPLTALGQTQVPQTLIAQYLQRIGAACGTTPTTANLAVSTTYNAAAARYQGIELDVAFSPLRNVLLDTNYDTQSASYLGVPDTILQQNSTIINGSQVTGIPLHKASATLSYGNRGFGAQIIGNYIGLNNAYNRPAFYFANGNVSQTVKNLTFTLAENNIFNSAGQIYGYFGHGLFQAENQFGSDVNSFQQGTEEFGLPPRQFYFSMSLKF